MKKFKALDLALLQIEEDFGKGAIMRLEEKHSKERVDSISTGALLDVAIGIEVWDFSR
jgi:recombination protein RecA